ncbi:MAG: hypothetical protein IJU29_05020 [Oscillospiraceae bacterium]|nr:hypothetical protein [Oscillospiraceae bacterium]
MKKNIAGLLCLFCLALLAGCGSKGGDGPPPDLTGRWRQVMDGGTPTFYQVAEIEGDRIRTWWHLSEDGSEYLYWIGTFVPPENDAEPYSWVSETRIDEERNSRTRQEKELTFTYKNGHINFIEIQGRVRMSVVLERAPEETGGQ